MFALFVSMCVYVSECACVCARIYIYAYIYTYTYRYIYKNIYYSVGQFPHKPATNSSEAHFPKMHSRAFSDTVKHFLHKEFDTAHSMLWLVF